MRAVRGERGEGGQAADRAWLRPADAGSGFGVQGSGFRVQGSGFRIQGLGVWGLGPTGVPRS